MEAFFMRQAWCFTVRYSLFGAPLEGDRVWLLAVTISLMLVSGVLQATPEEPAASVSQAAEEALRRLEAGWWNDAYLLKVLAAGGVIRCD